MTSEMNLGTNAATMKYETPMNQSERRIAAIVHSSSGKRIKISLNDWGINNHLVVLGSQVWYLGASHHDEFAVHMAQRDKQDGLRYVSQCLGSKQGLYRLLDRGILTQDLRHSAAGVFMLSDSIERQLESEAEAAERAPLFT